MSGLSPQQLAIVKLTAEGYSIKEIADKIGVKVNSVSKYKYQLENKIGIKGIANITKYAVREGIVVA